MKIITSPAGPGDAPINGHRPAPPSATVRGPFTRLFTLLSSLYPFRAFPVPSSSPPARRSLSLIFALSAGRSLSLAALSRSNDEFIGGSRAEWPCICPAEWPGLCFVRKANVENEAFIAAPPLTNPIARSDVSALIVASFSPLLGKRRRSYEERYLLRRLEIVASVRQCSFFFMISN